jgi:DNA-binding PadR family transcriptional regulator
MADDDDSAQRLHMLQREILSYLATHPEAKDTVEGIRHWWLPGGNARVTAGDIGSALDALVDKGWMNASSLGQGARVYSLNQARHREIREWLES